MSRPAVIEIDLQALKANLATCKQRAPQSKTIAVVKADAYGHGAIKVAQTLAETADMFAVSCSEEGMLLRQQGIVTPILLLEGCFGLDDWQRAYEQGFQLVIHHQAQLDALAVQPETRQFDVWLKVDTGMHRLGFSPEQVTEVYARLLADKRVASVKIITHLASADTPESDFTQRQLACFNRLLEQLTPKPQVSVANSAGIVAHANSARDWNRPGIMLYGIDPMAAPGKDIGLIPVMSFYSQIIALHQIEAGEYVGYGNAWQAQRPSLIATVAAGYGDGYPRNAPSGTPVFINGFLAPVTGRVSMDMLCVDVTDLPKAELGDRVELWGKHISVNKVAECAGTIGYELVTRLPQRVPRQYF